MDFSALVGMLAQRLRLPSIPQSEPGRLRLVFNDDMPLDIEMLADAPGICLTAEILKPAPGDRERLFTAVLERNLLRRLGSGAFLGLESGSDVLILCRRLTGDVAYPDLERALEEHVDEAGRLRTELGQSGPATSEEPFAFGGLRV